MVVNKLFARIFLPCVILFMSSACFSADVYQEFISPAEIYVHIDGDITAGDLEKLQHVAADALTGMLAYSPPTFVIDSKGGDIEEAMKIGLWLRSMHAHVGIFGKVIVTSDSEDGKAAIKNPNQPSPWVVYDAGKPLVGEVMTKAYSAAVLIFLGGAKRTISDNYDRRKSISPPGERIPSVGIHRPYFEKSYYSSLSPTEARAQYQRLDTLVRLYLKEMGSSQELIDAMFVESSNQLRLISSDDFKKYYKETEPYLEEWLIARCGSIGEKYVLTEDESNVLQGARKENINARIEAMKNGIQPEVASSIDLMSVSERDLFAKVRAHNVRVHECRDDAVFSHQRGWAEQYAKKRQ